MQSSSYAGLPQQFYTRLKPTPVAKPRLIQFNRALAAQLGLDLETVDAGTLAAIFAGNVLLPGADPIATAYAGHQFGHFVPQLGDGRAILLGEVRDLAGITREIQLKGSGRTPYSRNGDGRAALGPVLREYLLSEAMHAMTIPATRALAAVLTGESVVREQRLPGAILTRVAASHVRVGTFQFFASRGDIEATRRLADYVIDRLYPDARSSELPYLALLQAVTERQAFLIAGWMNVGFIHGVMNTDNMALSGETIDFGPCAFMDNYDSATVYSSIDSYGRYAYGNQPRIAQWNLARLAETLLPIFATSAERALELASEAVAAFSIRYEAHWLAGMRRKLGLVKEEESDRELAQDLLAVMHANQADFTLTFRSLAEPTVRALFADPAAFDQWALKWRARQLLETTPTELRLQAMRWSNPAVIPRNHRVEQAINAAVERDDFSPFVELLSVVTRPYEPATALAAYANAPQPDERVLETFCGT
jgi:serine/tyrosine/threonine adenylyltransferase